MLTFYVLIFLVFTSTSAYRCLTICDCSPKGESIVCAKLPPVDDAVLRGVRRVTLETPSPADLTNLHRVFPNAAHVALLSPTTAVGQDGRLHCPTSFTVTPVYICRRRRSQTRESKAVAGTVRPPTPTMPSTSRIPPMTTTTETTYTTPMSSAFSHHTRVIQRPIGVPYSLTIPPNKAPSTTPLESSTTTTATTNVKPMPSARSHHSRLTQRPIDDPYSSTITPSDAPSDTPLESSGNALTTTTAAQHSRCKCIFEWALRNIEMH